MDRENDEMPSTSKQDNMDFADDNEFDYNNLVDADEPELSRLDDTDDKKVDEPIEYDVMGNLLNEYGDDGNKLAEHFRLLKIEYRDLASLSENDLKQFGIISKERRRVMVDDFAELPNQYEYYEKTRTILNTKKYESDGLKNIQKHLRYLKLAISASLLKLHLYPADNVCFPNELIASGLVLKTLEEINRTSNLMEKQLSSLTSKGNHLKTSKYSKFWKIMLLLGAAGATAVGSAIFLRYCRTKIF